MHTPRIITAAAVAGLIALPAQADDRMYMTDAEFAALGEPSGPAPVLIDYTFGPSVETHMTCSIFTGEPEPRNSMIASSETGGNGFKMREADYHRLVAAKEIKADRWRWDASHPAYGKGC